MNFMLNLTPQEQDVLAEIIRLDDEYEALPIDKRAKFILSTEMRKEMRLNLKIEEKQFNIILGKLKKKTMFNTPLLDDKGILHPELKFKPDSDGFKIEVNLVMTTPKAETQQPIVEEQKQEVIIPIPSTIPTPPTEYKYDASKAPILEEEDFDFQIATPND
jgi:hypothetical protein